MAIDPEIGEARLPMVRRHEERRELAEADAELEKAVRLAPDSWEVNKEAGRMALLRRDVATAIAHFEKAVALMDSDFHAWAMLATCYQACGHPQKVHEAAAKMVSEAEQAVHQDPSNGAALGILAGGHAILGQQERAREWIERALLIDPDNVRMRYNFACVLAGHLGDADAALALLDRLFASAKEYLVRFAESDPDLNPIRDDPRFAVIIGKARRRLKLDDPVAPA